MRSRVSFCASQSVALKIWMAQSRDLPAEATTTTKSRDHLVVSPRVADYPLYCMVEVLIQIEKVLPHLFSQWSTGWV